MPISKIKSNAINDGAITIAKTNNLFVNTEITGTEAARMPVGTTAQRANAQVGDLRHNTNLGILEQYTTDGWQGIASSPTVTSVSPNNIEESDSTQTVVITGQNFDSGATAVLVGSGGNITPTTSTRNSSTQITIVYSGSDTITTDTGPYDVKVTNSTGLAGTLDDALTLDDAPNWTTAAGNVANVIEDEAMSTATVAATDPEGGTVTYSITSGALPSGLSFGTSNGQITGTPNAGGAGYSSSGVTHNFTVTANDGTGNTTPRAFNIIRKWRDGSTSALATTTSYLAANDIQVSQAYLTAPTGYSSLGTAQYDVYHDSTNNDYYIKLPGSWIRSNGSFAQLSSSSSSSTNFNYGSNGFTIQRRYGFDMDLRWSFTKYFVYMHSTDSDGTDNPDDTMAFTNSAFTGMTAGGQTIPVPNGSHTLSYTSRTETDANGNNLTLTPVSLMLNGYGSSNAGTQSFAFGTPGQIHAWKEGGEFAPNFQASGASSREIMFNMMPGSGYTDGTVTISNTAGTAPTNYRNFPMSAGSSAQTKFRAVFYDDGTEMVSVPDVEIWVNGT